MKDQDFLQTFPIPLNEQQMAAVREVNGPVLLLAVPGSGKTTVLVTRLGYMLYCCGIAPESILTLTYTRAAARDMEERFCSLFGTEYRGRLEFRTINSICDGIIRYYGNLIGKPPFQLESNEKQLGLLLSRIYREVEADFPSDNEIKNVRTWITYIKNMRMTSGQIEELGVKNDINLAAIYREYQTQMRRMGRMDYDDQMVYAYNILKQSPRTLAHFQQRYQYLCVDEAQDTSRIQHEIIALLAADNENLFMVGDEDQSIYGFRAAYPQALLEFGSQHPTGRVLLMEQNFRSSQNIVTAADDFIRHNTMRYEKHMTASRPAGAAIRRIELKGRKAQCSYLLKVAQGIEEERLRQKNRPEGIQKGGADSQIQQPRTAVLFRNNDSVLALVDLLERNQVPYRMQNRDLLFFSNRVVTDIRNIIQFAADPANAELFLQIYYKIGLYINRKDAENACRVSRSRRMNLLDALEKHCGLTGYRAIRVKAVRTNLERMLEESSSKAISRIMKALEYSDYLERLGLSDDKIGILRMLASNDMSPLEFLERLDWLKERIQTKEEDSSCNFILSTIHSSKGLEYENVYLMDCADGIFPQSIPKDRSQSVSDHRELEDYEEERRMFYVAVTRARDNLTIFALPQGSTFLEEMLGLSDEPLTGARLSGKDFDFREFQEFKDQLGEGIPVCHAKFGEGIVSAVDEHSVTVIFEDSGERSFNLRILFEKELLTVHS